MIIIVLNSDLTDLSEYRGGSGHFLGRRQTINVADAANTPLCPPRVQSRRDWFFDAVSQIAKEGNWSTPCLPTFGMCSPNYDLLGYDRLKVYDAFASCMELCEAAKNLLLGSDPTARRPSLYSVCSSLRSLQYASGEF